jgi:hypothetical protein
MAYDSKKGSSMSVFDPFTGINLDQLRARLAKMDDAELKRFGLAAAYVNTPEANLGGDPLPALVLQLEEACAEWWRRHPEDHESSGNL